MMRVTLIAIACVVGAMALKVDDGANPIRKIVTLLQDMQHEIEEEGKKEQELYDKYMCYCESSTADLAKAQEKENANIAELSAKLEQESAEKSTIDQELVDHKSDRESAKKDLAEATSIREKEAATFASDEAEQKVNIAALTGSLPALEKGMGASALVQLPGNPAKALTRLVKSAVNINDYDRSQVLSFLEEQGDYAPQSGQIVGILKVMLEDMTKNLAEATAAEQNAAAGYEQLKDSKNKEVAAASSAIETKTARSGELAVSVVTSKNALEDSEEELADTTKYLADLKANCQAQTTAWGARKAARAEEVSAISDAISILNDDDALDVFKKTVPSAAALPQMGFLQKADKSASKFEKVRAIIASVASKSKNARLELISYSVTKMLKRSTGAFGGMDQMIDSMISLLGTEQSDDEKQKEWCDGELDSSADEKKGIGEKGEQIQATVSELSDAIKTMADEIDTLSLEIKALDASVAQATVQRKEEHQEHTEAMALNEAAVQLLEKAKNRLNKLYNPSIYKEEPKKELSMEDKMYVNAGRSEWAGLAQIRKHKVAPPPPPATFDAYTRKDSKSTGVLALMDMMLSDLKRDMETSSHAESEAQKEYESLMKDSTVSRAQSVKGITDKEASKGELERKLQESKENHMLNQKDMQNVDMLIASLHTSCDFILNNFDLRKEARTNEIESLKNAKSVLHGATNF